MKAGAKSASSRSSPETGPLAALFAWLGAAFFLAPFLYAFCFCQPRGDDFDEATRAMHMFDLVGGLHELVREWLTWSGRFSYHFLAVFLGRAVENRLLHGAVCFFCLCLFTYACHRLARFCAPRIAGIFAALATASLLSCHAWAPDYYSLTDALTCGLQASAFLLFLAFLAQWRADARDDEPGAKTWLAALASGIFAIGLYEHSALAVFWTATARLCAAAFKWGHKREGWKALRAHHLARRLFSLWLCLCTALAFSFFAPGNFQRNLAREVRLETQLRQLIQAPLELWDALSAFIFGPWPLVCCCLTLLLGLSGERKALNKDSLAIIILAPCAFTAFAISVASLHAMSDAPLGSAVKLGASVGVYAAIALCLVFLPLASALPRPGTAFGRGVLFCAVLAVLFTLLGQSANFRQTARNAVNGELLLLEHFMETRLNYLKSLGEEHKNWREYGILGLIIDPGMRARPPKDKRPAAIVASWPRPVFPVCMGEPLAPSPDIWPNKWAAWLRGLSEISAVPPNGNEAVEMARKGAGKKQPLPESLARQGVREAWKVAARGQNPTFSLDWLVLRIQAEPADPGALPASPLCWKRFAPLPMQARLLERITSARRLRPDLLTALGASMPAWEPVRHGEFVAIPLGQGDIPWPAPPHISLDGEIFSALAAP